MKPTLGVSSGQIASTSRCPTMVGRPTRTPLRTVRVKSALRRSRDGEGRIRHSASRDPCACGQRAQRARHGCACAAGSHASWRGAGCSAGTCAYSRKLQGYFVKVGSVPGTRFRRAAHGINQGYHLEHRRLPGMPRCRDLGCGKLFSPSCHGHRVQPGYHVHNMWIVLWIVSSSSRQGGAMGALNDEYRPGRDMGTVS